MGEIIRCKRCKAKLTNLESIKMGYGKTCYRIIQLQERVENKQESYKIEINFLKCEINMLKRMMKQIQTMGIKNIEAIERIRNEGERPERDANKGNFFVIVKELKIFLDGDFKKKLVKAGTYTDKELGIKSVKY